MTENDHDARQADRIARRERRRRRLFAGGFFVVAGLGVAAWGLYYEPLTEEERAFVGRWEAPQYELYGGYRTYEWEFKSNHTARRRMLVKGESEPGTSQEFGWSVTDGKLVLVFRHADWASRLKSGNTQVNEAHDIPLTWDGPDRFSFDPPRPGAKAFVLVRRPLPAR